MGGQRFCEAANPIAKVPKFVGFLGWITATDQKLSPDRICLSRPVLQLAQFGEQPLRLNGHLGHLKQRR